MDFTAACKLLLLTVGCRLILDSASLILPMLMTSHCLRVTSRATAPHQCGNGVVFSGGDAAQPGQDNCHGDDQGRSATAQLAVRRDRVEVCIAGPLIGHDLPVRPELPANFQPFGAAHVGQPLIPAQAL